MSDIPLLIGIRYLVSESEGFLLGAVSLKTV